MGLRIPISGTSNNFNFFLSGLDRHAVGQNPEFKSVTRVTNINKRFIDTPEYSFVLNQFLQAKGGKNYVEWGERRGPEKSVRI